MHLPSFLFRRSVLLCCALLLAACASAPPQPSPSASAPTASAQRRSAPTAAPAQPSVAPTLAAPSAVTAVPSSPAHSARLPQPLYSLINGQIWRIERDATTRQQVTFEPDPVREFDLRPTDNALVYISGSEELTGTRSLIALDTSGRTELFTGPVSTPLIRPVGDEIAFALHAAVPGLIIGQDSSPTGVWLTMRGGGRPSVLLADVPLPETSTPGTERDAHYYSAFAWSPDGTRVIISDYPGIGEGANTGVVNRDDLKIVFFKEACCGEAVWSSDGATVVQAGGIVVQDSVTGLWRIDPRTGVAQTMLPGQIDDKFALITAPRANADGSVNVFMTLAAESPEVNPDAFGALIMTRVTPDGKRTPLRPNDTAKLYAALWAADGSGAVGFGKDAQGKRDVALWLTADGSAAVPLALGEQTRWGGNAPQANPHACDAYRLLAWQAPAARRAEASVAELQGRLRARGFTIDTIDGLYGDQTRAAVRSFQETNGLPASGDVNCATWAKLLR